MKRHKILIIISLSVILGSCKEDEKKLFSFNEANFKAMYHTGETLSLAVINQKQKAIDSVVFFNNNRKIGTIKGNETFNYKIQDEKLGFQNLKAEIFYEGEKQEISSSIELVASKEPQLLKYKIINTYPHDLKAYTQGLEFYKGVLLEGTGNGSGNGTGEKGISSLRKTNYLTGKVNEIVELPDAVFGEGITVLNDKIYQLTWLNNEGYVYDAKTFKKEKTFKYPRKMEGWGLTSNGKHLFMTNSSERISILNPNTFEEVDYINVYTNNTKVTAVNELEWINGKIYANIYQKDAIAVINPKTGAVEAVINLSELKNKITQHADVDVLNGIAYNSTTNTLFVTGKNWDKMFEIKLLD